MLVEPQTRLQKYHKTVNKHFNSANGKRLRDKGDFSLHYDENEDFTKYGKEKGEGFSDENEDEFLELSDDVDDSSNKSEDVDRDYPNDSEDEASTEADENWSERA